jgi:cytochrome b involved in lipid metabolism
MASVSPVSATPATTASKYISMDEIQDRVKNKNEVLIVFSNKVYNLTKWAKFHPGGDLAIIHMNGELLCI